MEWGNPRKSQKAKDLKKANSKLGYKNYGREIYYTRKRSLAIR